MRTKGNFMSASNFHEYKRNFDKYKEFSSVQFSIWYSCHHAAMDMSKVVYRERTYTNINTFAYTNAQHTHTHDTRTNTHTQTNLQTRKGGHEKVQGGSELGVEGVQESICLCEL
jgi:hypothetical protein